MSTHSRRGRRLTCAWTDAPPWGRDSLLQQSVWGNCLRRHCTRGHFGAPMAPGNPQASCMGLSCCVQVCLHLSFYMCCADTSEFQARDHSDARIQLMSVATPTLCVRLC